MAPIPRSSIRTDARGDGPTFAQMHVCVGQDEAQCRKTALEMWPNAALKGQLAQDLPTCTHFEQAVDLVTEDDVAEAVPCGPDVEPIVEKARAMIDSGYDHVYFHQIGPDQDAFFDMWSRELGECLRSLD